MANRSGTSKLPPPPSPRKPRNATLEAALHYAANGIPIFPVNAKKEPLTAHGFYDATTDAASIRAWWLKEPGAGVAIPTGASSGFVVVDLDPRNGSDATVAALEKKHGPFPATVTSRTGGGGTHLLFRHPGGTIPCGADKLGPGVDIKADGGYIVVPPSPHESGGTYAWLVEHGLGQIELAELPAWSLPLIREPKKRERAPRSTASEAGAPFVDGHRNEALASLAGTMRRRGMSARSILAALVEENAARCKPPLDRNEVQKIAESITRYTPTDPISPPAPEAERPIEEPHHTDTGNAARFVRDHGGDVLFCHPWNRWLVWDGVRWARDERGEISRRSLLTVCRMHEDAGRLVISHEDRKLLAKHALRSESERARKAMIELAKSELPVVPDELDLDPWLLNVENGTVHLRDGKLFPHSRDDRLTKCAGTYYDPGAECPRWLAFLDRIFAGDAELIAFVHRALGYSLSGETNEEAFFVAHGSGANGKSTLFGVVQEIMGDYATATRAETVLAKRNPDSIPNDVAALMGARFVSAIEAEEGRRLAAGLVKSLTGRDRISARFMRGEFFEFSPSFKLWLGVNHKPRIRDSSPAMWRRVKLVPFTVTIPEPERDPELRGKLLAEGPGILAWLVRGCVEWKEHGLGSCASVEQATRSYRDESNAVAEWAALACTVRTGAKAKHAELYAAFRAWCESEGEEPLGSRAFGDRLEEAFHTVRRGKVGDARGFLGIEIGANEGGPDAGF